MNPRLTNPTLCAPAAPAVSSRTPRSIPLSAGISARIDATRPTGGTKVVVRLNLEVELTLEGTAPPNDRELATLVDKLQKRLANGSIQDLAPAMTYVDRISFDVI